MNKKLATALVFFTVISGVIARAEFVSDIDFKLYIRILDFGLLLVLFAKNIEHINIKKIELFILWLSAALILVEYKEDLINFIYICLFTIVIRDFFKLRQLVEVLLVSTIISVILVFTLWIFGITDGIVWFHSAKGAYVSQDLSLLFDKLDGYRVRFAFGMNHPNSFSLIIVSLIALLFLSKKSIGICIINIALSFMTYYFTDSKNIIYFTVCLYTMYFLFSYYRSARLKYTPILLIIFSLMVSIFMVGTPLDDALSGRIYLWNDLLSGTSLKDWLLGKSIEEYVIDNGYIHVIFGGGICIALYFVHITRGFLSKLESKVNVGMLAFVITFLIFNVVEESFLRFENAATILFWWLILADSSQIDIGAAYKDLDYERHKDKYAA